MVRALAAVAPVDEDVFIALSAPGGPSVTDVVARLQRSLAGSWPVVLALDAVEVLDAPASLSLLTGLADQLPAGSQLALASRREPDLPIGRLRAQRRLLDLRPRELAMTRREATALLRGAGLKPTADDVVALVRRTEGWPAGLVLAALAARGEEDRARALRRFTGANRLVVDYLRDEMLGGLHDEELRLLTRSSILDVLSGPVCDATLGCSGSGALLRDLARANVLLVCLDQSDDEYRLHTLFADMLGAELRRVEPDREHELQRRAAAWYAQQGDLDRAIEHAVSAKDAEAAGTLLWANAAPHVLHGRTAAIRAWLDRFSAAQRAGVPGLALTAAAVHLVLGGRDLAEHWAAAAERALSATVVPDRSTLAGGVALVRAGVCRDGLVRMGEDAAAAYALADDDSPWRSLSCLLAGVAARLTGDSELGRAQLQEGARRGGIAAPAVQVLCLAQLALMASGEDDWDEAESLSARARAQVERVGLADCPLSALVLAVSARVRAQRGRTELAQEDRRAALRLLGELSEFAPWYTAELRLTLAGTAVRLGDVAAARSLAADAARDAHELPDAVVLVEGIERVAAAAARLAAHVALEAAPTTAELRVLQLLPTHLSFREMAGGLHVTANTVKSHAHAVYRKLDASSRSEAVVQARSAGLLGSSPDAAIEPLGAGDHARPGSLTPSELRILHLLPSELSYGEIGARLRLSANTVKTHAEASYRKLAACTRDEAVARARLAGLLV